VSNYATLTDDPTLPKVQRDNSWNYSDGLSFVHGAHTVKAGFQGIRFQLNYLRDQNQRGQFSYTGAYTKDLNSPRSTGDAFADFLLGLSAEHSSQHWRYTGLPAADCGGSIRAGRLARDIPADG